MAVHLNTLQFAPQLTLFGSPQDNSRLLQMAFPTHAVNRGQWHTLTTDTAVDKGGIPKRTKET